MTTGNGGGRDNTAIYNLLAVMAVGLFVVIGVVSDAITMNQMMDLAQEFGLPGVVLVLWWLTDKGNRTVLSEYKKDMEETRQMYRNNVHLVEGYASLAQDHQNVVMMNTQAMTRLGDQIQANQYCPLVRRPGDKQEAES